MTKKYYTTIDRNGTEDEIRIYSPEGNELAFIWFWDEIEGAQARAEASAALIVDALNAYRRRMTRTQRQAGKE